jgi:anthranilate/para-aminobenzoate synthase component I
MASSGKPRRRRPAGLRRNLQGPLQRADHPGLPRFNGGLVGYFGYDCVRYVEKRLGACPNPDPLGVPDILLMVSDAVVVFDNLAGKMHAIVLVDPAEEQAFEQGQARLQGLLETCASRSPRAVAWTSAAQAPSRCSAPASPGGLRERGRHHQGIHPGR